MNSDSPTFGLLVLLIELTFQTSGQTACPRVDAVKPNVIGTGGGVPVQIRGCGFSSNIYLPGVPNSFDGNRVTLENEFHSHTVNLVDQEPEALKFVSPPAADGLYTVKVFVNDSQLTSTQCPENICRIELITQLSPLLEVISPRYIIPGDTIQITGRVFGRVDGQIMDEYYTGALLSIQSGSFNCEVVASNGGITALAGALAELHEGSLHCKTSGYQIGDHNISVLLDAPFGKSIPIADVFMVASQEEPFMIQNYAIITSVEPTSSNPNGGAELTIGCSCFKQPHPPKVFVGNYACNLLSFNDNEIKCQLQRIQKPSNQQMFAGGRGIQYEEYENVVISSDDQLKDLDFGQYAKAKVDTRLLFEPIVTTELHPKAGNTVRLVGVFIPPKESDYQFSVMNSTRYRLIGGMLNSNPLTMTVIEENFTVNLTVNDMFALDLRAVATKNNEKPQICVKLFDTKISQQRFPRSVPSVQRVRITSNEEAEIQEINHAGLLDQTMAGIEEVQEIDINAAVKTVKLCIFESCTPKFPFASVTSSQLSTYLSEQLGSSNAYASITRQEKSRLTLLLDFPEDFGDVPPVTVKTSSAAAITVTEVTKGLTPVNGQIRSSLQGLPSMISYPVDGTAQEVRDAIFNLRLTHCPKKLTSVDPLTVGVFEDFESGLDGGACDDVPAFCGRYSYCSPAWFEFDPPVSLSKYPYLCFAVMGDVQNQLQLRYRAEAINETMTDILTQHNMNMTVEDVTKWRYRCLNALNVVRSERGGYFSLFYLNSFKLLPNTQWLRPSEKYYLDNIYVGKEPPHSDVEDISTWPRFPKKLFSEVTVTKQQTRGKFTVQLKPVACENAFDLIGIAGIDPPDDTTSNGVARSIRDSRWPIGTETIVTRKSLASKPISGSLVLSFRGIFTAPIPIDVAHPEYFTRILQAHPLLSQTHVSASGLCNDLVHTIEFASSGGQQPVIGIEDITKLQGDNVRVTADEVVRGYLQLCPIPGDMISELKSTQQVRVYINNILAKCNTSCEHTFSPTATPTLTSAALKSDQSNTLLEITGSGFNDTEATMNEMYFLVDNEPTLAAKAVTSTKSKLVFYQSSINQIPAGTLMSIIHVYKAGYTAPLSIDLGTAGAEITSVMPNTGSLEGGMIVDVQGSRFSPWSARCLINGKECSILKINTTSLQCVVPACDVAGQFTISLEQNGVDITSAVVYTYDASFSPISAEEPTSTVAPDTGDSEILVAVNKLSKQAGSWMGGQILTIHGDGFTSNMMVYMEVSSDNDAACLGPRNAECIVVNTTQYSITCTTGSMTKEHFIRNDGTDENLGFGYRWKPEMIIVMQGDTVTWKWTNPTPNNELRIYQVSDLVAFEPVTDGFQNDPNVKGTFTLQLTKPGTYYFASGTELPLFGIVEVKPLGDCVAKVVVESGQNHARHFNVLDATYNSQSSVTNKPICTELQTPSTLINVHTFAVRKCLTLLVEDFSPKQITASTVITVNTFGLETLGNHIEIKFSEAVCEQQSADALYPNRVQCSITAVNAVEAYLTAGQLLDLNVIHTDFGTALFTTFGNAASQPVTFMPEVNSMSDSTHGSICGGGRLTIRGSGFNSRGNNNNRVTIGNAFECVLGSVTSAEINCVISAISTGVLATKLVTTYPTKVDVLDYTGQWVTASCMSGLDCSYYFDPAFTPQITSIQPTSLTQFQTLTLTGSELARTSENYAELQINVSSIICTPSQGSNQNVVCELDGSVPFGVHKLTFLQPTRGWAFVDSNLQLRSDLQLNAVTPNTGSLAGGTNVVLQGNGLDAITNVLFGTAECASREIQTSSQLTCVTPAATISSGTRVVNVIVIVDSSNQATLSDAFTYDDAITPRVTSVNSAIVTYNGAETHEIRIEGTLLLGSTSGLPKVLLGEKVQCALKDLPSPTATHIECTSNQIVAGGYSVSVNTPDYGNAVSSANLQIALSFNTIVPDSGSLMGGQSVTFSGTGFAGATTTVQICGRNCEKIQGSSILLVCVVPQTTFQVNQPCDVLVSVLTSDGQNSAMTKVGAYTYDIAKTPKMSTVVPSFGSVKGGTNLLITGEGFQTPVSVIIGGSVCGVQSSSNNQIVCTTSQHNTSGLFTIEVHVDAYGSAQGTLLYQYVNLWSDSQTWDGYLMPAKGSIVVIPPTKTVLLDVNPPPLQMLLINGGTLLFDPMKDIELQVHYILVFNNGFFKIGSPEQPHPSKATVTLLGQSVQHELPIYGSKVLALRSGTISIHGLQRTVTWTKLTETVDVGGTVIKLAQPVDWKSGETILLTSTDRKVSYDANEVHVIDTVESDQMTVHLVTPIKQRKLVETISYSKTVQGVFAAEVGLLTHNVVIQGKLEATNLSKVSECPFRDILEPGKPDICSANTASVPIITEKYGGIVHIHRPTASDEIVAVHISSVEFRNMGQAFRKNRYPIYFNYNGLMTKSYIKGCSIHETFNRAIGIRYTHELLVEQNVMFNIMGSALVLEEGSEHGNEFQYNLVVATVSWPSLLEEDTTPAAYWIRNANNTVQQNSLAGGSHTGFWYRILDYPDGQSQIKGVCPNIISLGKFSDNTVHSQGGAALRLEEAVFLPDSESCGSADWNVFVFSGLFAWNNAKTVECVNCVGVQLASMLSVNNIDSAFEGHLTSGRNLYIQLPGPTFTNAHVVGYESTLSAPTESCNSQGIVLTPSAGLTVSEITMHNFKGVDCTAIKGALISRTCESFCGGFEYKVSKIVLENTDNVAKFRWSADFGLRDNDGTLLKDIAGTAPKPGGLIIGNANYLPTDKCGSNIVQLGSAFKQGAVAGTYCLPEVTPIRLAMSVSDPPLTNDTFLQITLLRGGTETFQLNSPENVISSGWTVILVNDNTYIVNVVNPKAPHIKSYNGYLENFRSSDYIIIRHEGIIIKPDRIGVLSGVPHRSPSLVPLDPLVNVTGDTYYNASGQYVEYLVKAPATPSTFVSYQIAFTIYNCLRPDCLTFDPNDTVTIAPSNIAYWSDDAAWGANLGPKPTNGSSLTVPKDTYLIVDTSINVQLEIIRILGTLEFVSGTKDSILVYQMSFKQMLIVGRLIAGSDPSSPLKYAKLVLTAIGAKSDTDQLTYINGPIIGPKAIAVFGQMLMHAQRTSSPWTRLAKTAEMGSNQIEVESAVLNWESGDKIVIATTSKNFQQSEEFLIKSVTSDGMMITLDGNLQHKHLAYNEQYGDRLFQLGGEVASLSASISIEGDEETMQKQFGGRILVSVAQIDGQPLFGQLRLSGVRFYGMGQPSSSDTMETYGFALAFINCSDVQGTSYVRSSVFVESLSDAIGIYGTGGVEIDGTVIYKTAGSGISVMGTGNRITNTVIIWSGQWLYPTSAQYAMGIRGALDTTRAPDTVLLDVTVAGAERICLASFGVQCLLDINQRWDRIVLHSCLIGLSNLAKNLVCSRVANLQIYSTSEFSVYWRTDSSIEAENIQMVDNKGGLYPFIGLPDAYTSEKHNKNFTLTNSLLVGRSGLQTCEDSAVSFALSRVPILAGPKAPGGGNLGVTAMQFMSSTDSKGKNGFVEWSTEFSLGGAGYIHGITIANFGSFCTGARDMFWRTDTKNEDLMQPSYFENVVLINVSMDNIAYFDRPQLMNVRNGRCGNMECDGLKKTILVDKDGTLLGAAGTVIAQSEWQYDKNALYGVGTSKLPKYMLTKSPNVNAAWPNKGIIRDASCQYVTAMQAYHCGNTLQHRLLLIESLDKDRLDRRLAPLALVTEGLQSDFLDLINGPGFRRPCTGISCSKRLNVYVTVVAKGHNFAVYFTNPSPQRTRLTMLQAADDYSIRLAVVYSRSARTDVYVDGVYKIPVNGKFSDQGQMITTSPSYDGEYIPNVENASIGSNYYDENTETLYMILKGSTVTEVVMTQKIRVVLWFPSMTLEDFNKNNVMGRLAQYLKIPIKMLRLLNANIVTGTALNRQTRQTGTLEVDFEISEPPKPTIAPIVSQPTTITESAPTEIESLSGQLVSSAQTGSLDGALQASISNVRIEQPLPQPGTAQWNALTSSGTTTVTNHIVVQIPSTVSGTVVGTVVEGVPATVRIGVNDAANVHITQLGSDAKPWLYSITSSSMLTQIENRKFSVLNNGWADATDVYIKQPGKIQLGLTVSDPDAVKILRSSVDATAIKRDFWLKAAIIAIEGDNTWASGMTIPTGSRPTFRIQMFNKIDGQVSAKLDWRDFRWKLKVSACSQDSSEDQLVDPKLADYNWSRMTFETGSYSYCFKMNAYQSDGITRMLDYDPNTAEVTFLVGNVYIVQKVFSFLFETYTVILPVRPKECADALMTKLKTQFSGLTFGENRLIGQSRFNVLVTGRSDLMASAETALQKSVSHGDLYVQVDDETFKAIAFEVVVAIYTKGVRLCEPGCDLLRNMLVIFAFRWLFEPW